MSKYWAPSHHEMGMTYEAVGLVLGCSGENVRKIERRAIKKLLLLAECREILDEYINSPNLCSLWEAIETGEEPRPFGNRAKKRGGQQ